jgi:tripartite ATP-independent transporter DctP family solute receptor
MNTRRFSLVLVSIALLLSACGMRETPVLKLGHSLDQNHPVHLAMVHMSERLVHYSNGQMKVDIYPGGQLGSERELIELLQIGALAMTKVSASPMESFVPAMKVFSMPYVFRDQDHYWQFLESPHGRKLLLAGEPYRLRGLCYYDAGSRSFYTIDQPVREPADLSGLKIRVQKSQTSVQMVEALGGAATPIAWGELYTALQQGVVDGAENNPPSFYQSRHYEVSRYYTLDEHTSVPDILLIGLPVWKRLSEEQQGWLTRAVADSVVFQRALWKQRTREALNAVREAGVEIIVPDKTAFQQASQSMQRTIKNPEIRALLDAIRTLNDPVGEI